MYKQIIDNYIEEQKNEIITDIMDLVKIPSCFSSPNKKEPFGIGAKMVLECAESKLKNKKFIVTNYDNYVVTADLNDKEKGLDILAHLDVVPEGTGWSVTNAFQPIVKDERIYGRGTSDDKGPAVAAMYALQAIQELNIPLQKNVRLILGSNEEAGSEDLEYYYRKENVAPYTFTPDAAFPVINAEKGFLHGEFGSQFCENSNELVKLIELVAGEAVNMLPSKAYAVVEGIDHQLCLEKSCEVSAKTGIIFKITGIEHNQLKIEAQGQSCHASTPEQGKNSISGLLYLLTGFCNKGNEVFEQIKALYELFKNEDIHGKSMGIDMEDEKTGILTIALTKLNYQGGEMNGTFDCRIPSCGNNENVRDVISHRLKDIGFYMNKCSVHSAHYVSEDSVFIRKLLKSYEIFSKEKGYVIKSSGTTYVHNINNGVAFGCENPNINNHIHGPNEFVEIKQILMSAKIFAQAIIELCS